MTAAPDEPKLRRDLVTSEQATPDGRVFVVKDPRTSRFYRFREVESFIIQQLDGDTSRGNLARRVEARFGTAVSEATLTTFLDQLKRLGLLETEASDQPSPSTPQKRIRGDLLYLRFKAFDPDRLLGWLVPKLRFCFTRHFVIGSALAIVTAFMLTLVNGDEISRDMARLFRVETLFYAWLILILVTIGHEFAHGLTCKHFGGEVHEMGFMLIYFQPALYCNISEAWLFPEKAKRLWVTFAGAYFDILLWALATLTWRVTNPDTWVSFAAMVVMATAGIKTLFNMNPLIKLDGYYLLSDALGIPNLRARAFGFLKAARQRLLGVADAAALQDTPRREQRIFLAYGLLAGVYSVMLLSSVAWWAGGFLTTQYQGPGFLLFAGLLMTAFRNPLKRSFLKLPEVIRSGPGWFRAFKRPVKGLLLAGVAAALLFFVRLDLTVSGEFTVLPFENADVRAEVDGIIEKIFVEEGDRVQTGDLIARLSDRDYRAELDAIEATIREKQAKLKMLEAGPRPEEIALARQAVSTAKTRQEEARKRHDEAQRLREDRLTRAQATEQKVREQLRYAEQNLNRLRPLLDKEFISQKDFQDAHMEVSVRRMELEEAQATLHMVLADDLSAFSQEMALAEAERKESESRLQLLLAGSRPEEIEATQAEIASLAAQQRHLQHKLERVWIRTPHAGVITTPTMKEKIGQQVQKGDLIAEVHELKTIMAEISVPEGEIADIAIGQPIALKARAYPGLTFTGTVTEIAPAVLEPPKEVSAPTSIRVIRVLTQIDNAQGFLKSRMTGYAKISCGERPLMNLITRRMYRYLRVEFWSWW